MDQSPELEGLVSAWFEAASRSDASLVDRHVSGHEWSRLIGNEPSEWLVGSAVAEFLRGEAEGSGGNVKFTPSEPEAFEEGTVGWAATRLTITLPDGKHVAPRWSAVFHKEDGVWRFVQTHSIAVPNDEVG